MHWEQTGYVQWIFRLDAALFWCDVITSQSLTFQFKKIGWYPYHMLFFCGSLTLIPSLAINSARLLAESPVSCISQLTNLLTNGCVNQEDNAIRYNRFNFWKLSLEFISKNVCFLQTSFSNSFFPSALRLYNCAAVYC